MASEKFLEQFSKTLSAGEHPSTRQNIAAAQRLPQKLPDALAHSHTVRPVGRPCPAYPSALRRPLRRPLPLPVPRHPAHRQQGGQGVNSQAEAMHQPSSAACKAEAQGPPAPSTLPSAFGILPRLAFWRPAGYISPRHMQGNRAGNRFPLATDRGFCTPCRRSSSCCRSARTRPPSTKHTRPLDLRPGGLGGALWRIRDDLQGL